MNRPVKLISSTTPIHGWIMRADWPPPNSPVRKNRLGWKNARPDSASRMRLPAVIQ
jgi:hypothetical protein